MAEAAALNPRSVPSGAGSQFGVPFEGAAWAMMIFLVSASNLMEVLDLTIANVSINTISGSLGVSVTEGTWIVTSYAVASAIAVPMAGWLAGRFGVVKVFVLSVALFGIASLCCALSTTLAMLVTSRILQGASAGLMMTLSQAVMMSNSPPRLRSMSLAIWGMTITVGPILGPLLGGYISANYHWSWVFMINVPPALLISLVAWNLLRDREGPTVKLPVDVVGIMLVVIWVGSLQILLDKGNELDWFGSRFIVGLAITAGVGFCLFMAWELTDDHPLVDLRLFRYWNFAIGMLILSLGFTVYFSNIVLLPITLQTAFGYNSDWAGRIMAPAGALAVIISPFVGRALGKKADPRLFATGGFIVFAICSYWRGTYTLDASLFRMMLPQILIGLGSGMFFAPVVGILTSAVPVSEIAKASSFYNFGRMVMASFGSALIITSWDHRTVLHRARLVEMLPDQSPRLLDGVNALQQSGLPDMGAYGVIDRLVDAQAQLMAANDLFVLSAVLYVLCLGTVWLARPPFAPPGGAGH